MVVAVNQFHNKFVDSSEWLSYSGSVVMNERYYTQGATNGGAVLVNVSGTSTSISNMTVNTLGDGEYTDALTNNKFTVSNGKISGDIGSTGVAVIY
jgi:alpha-amylase